MPAKIFYRTFKNMDGPGLCHLWNQSWYAKVRGETVRDDSFDQFIASKLIFEPKHLVVAVEPPEKPDCRGLSDGRIVGFVHGGFGPNQEMNGCDQSIGYIALLIVEQREDQQDIYRRLLYEMERIFFQMGIRTVFAGAVYPNAPFYSGRVFGCELNGILENDPFLPPVLRQNHYIAVERYHILTFVLRNSIPLNFSQRFLASRVEVVTRDDVLGSKDRAYGVSGPAENTRSPEMPISRDWWEACAHSNMDDWKHYVLRDRETCEPIAWVGASTMARNDKNTLLGLHHLYVKPQFRHQGYAKLLLTRVLNLLHRNHSSCQVELLVSEKNSSALQMFTGLHFEIASTGNVYRRELPADFPETFPMDCDQQKGTEIHA